MKDARVASFTDAWIETPVRDALPLSHTVASFTDAWIETGQKYVDATLSLSHLLQMRGLKHSVIQFWQWQSTSHLLQMRGLKLREWNMP